MMYNIQRFHKYVPMVIGEGTFKLYANSLCIIPVNLRSDNHATQLPISYRQKHRDVKLNFKQYFIQ